MVEVSHLKTRIVQCFCNRIDDEDSQWFEFPAGGVRRGRNKQKTEACSVWILRC